MNNGVPSKRPSPSGDGLPATRRLPSRMIHKTFLAGWLLLGSFFTLPFASSALAATTPVGLASAAPFSVLAGSTITNTGATTMSGDLGLSPGPSVTGAPLVLGQEHVDDALAIEAKVALTTAFDEAAAAESNGSSGSDISNKAFTPGVHTASSSLLLSAGTVTLNAEGNPNAVFLFQIPSTLITEANTTVSLINGAQACNVFWEVGSSATLGTGTQFVGTIMAAESITANLGATIQGRLLTQTGAVTLDDNVITTSACAAAETPPPVETPETAPTPVETPETAPTPVETPETVPTPVETPGTAPTPSETAPTPVETAETAPTPVKTPETAPPTPVATPETALTPVETAETAPPTPVATPETALTPVETPITIVAATLVPNVTGPMAPKPEASRTSPKPSVPNIVAKHAPGEPKRVITTHKKHHRSPAQPALRHKHGSFTG